MKLLTTFLLIGTVDKTDQFFATVEINMNPATMNIGHAIMPLTAFPCPVAEGDTFYILKLTTDSDPVIVCKDEYKSYDGD